MAGTSQLIGLLEWKSSTKTNPGMYRQEVDPTARRKERVDTGGKKS